MLNENQQAAARHLNGPMMVLAGPGSGKTAVITSRAGLLSEREKTAGILVITYSRAAAQVMERRFGGEKNSRVTFGTFHSAFFRMLRRKGADTAQILSDGERRGAVEHFLSEMKFEPDYEMLSSLLSEMSLVRNELHDLDFYHSKSIGTDEFIFLCKAYEAWKLSRNKIDFDDMLCRAHGLLKNDAAELGFWRKKYRYIMIDEFQDINRVQYETIKLLAAPENNLFVVGDDDQSIYRFRGSRPEFLLNFPKDFPETKQITLEINYRSTNPIIKYANELISCNKMRYSKNISGTKRDGPMPVFLSFEDQNEEAAQIAGKIRELQKRGANLNEIAVAFRLNMQARAFADAFLNFNIPFQTRDEMPTIYEHWLAEDIFAYLQAAQKLGLRQKTGFDADVARIINKPFRYVGKAFLQAAKKADASVFQAYKRDKSLHISTKTSIEELERGLLCLSKEKTADAIRYIRQNLGYNGHINDTCEYRRLNPEGLFEVADELQDAAKPFKTARDFIQHARNTIAASKSRNNFGECVTLTTLHSAKGLEFERMFIAGVVEDVLPYIRSKTEEEIEEERRLFYVGATRAKHKLYISTIKTRHDKPAKPSRFLQ